MSAFVVPDNHINSIVTWANRQRLCDEPQSVGQLLLDENYRSVNYRYRENTEIHQFIWTPSNAKQLSPIEAIKAIDGLMYQSCEHEEWKDSIAYKTLREWKETAITKIKGYEEAEWCIY